MAELERDDLVGLSLANVTSPEPPAELTRHIMLKVADVEANFSPWKRWRRAIRARRLSETEQRVLVTRRVLWSLAGLSAAAALIFVVIGLPNVGSGTEGTIGVANHAVADHDLQQFLQSETFARIASDPAARAALQKILSNPDLAAALANPTVLDALSDPSFIQAVSRSALAPALANPVLRNALATPSLRANVAAALK